MKLRIPDITTVVLANETLTLTNNLSFDGGYVAYDLNEALEVSVKSEKQGVSFIYLRWNEEIDENVRSSEMPGREATAIMNGKAFTAKEICHGIW